MSYQQVSIQDRTKKFAVRIVKACVWLEEESKLPRMLANQLLRSGTSIGANCSEAKSAQSRRDFISKYEIALKEARETKYWRLGSNRSRTGFIRKVQRTNPRNRRNY
ncbi:MAG: four helix bundle protein [Moorea sp. SIO3G5]|nr:four helix bundle protein [Moorena sp. SIO3G5]